MKLFTHIITTLRLPALFVALVSLAGCSQDDGLGGCVSSGPVPTRVSVSVSQEGDLNARAGETEGGQEHEFMHDLCVLFVQGGQVKLKLQPDLSADPNAMKGDLAAWTSGEQTLEAGNYTVYAFANLGSTQYDAWSEGSSFADATNPEKIVLEDPAGSINFAENKYIPMSAKEEVNISDATSSVEIGLDRLVTKIRMSEINTTSTTDVKVKQVKFSGYADKVSLIQDAELSGATANKEYTYTPKKGEEITISSNKPGSVPDFYVNETREAEPATPFTIEVTTEETEGTYPNAIQHEVTYRAETNCASLPRNHILPITLNLNQSELQITATVYDQVIGHEVVQVTPVSGDRYTSLYQLSVPYGSLFYLELSNDNDITYSTTDCKWWSDENNNGNLVLMPSDTNVADATEPVTGTTVWGITPGDEKQKGQTYPIYLYAKWAASTITYNRTYTINIEVKDKYDFNFDTNTPSTGSLYLNKEHLTLFIKR